MVRNEQILRDVLLKMNYDSSKTLNENIKEQSRFELDFNRTYSDPKKAAQANREMSEFVSEYRHELIDIASIGFFFIPGVGPLISLGLELANSGLYYSEGDKYMAGFSLAFAFIPGAELFAKIPSIKKLGRDGLASLIKKARSGGKLTKIELEVAEQIGKNADEIKKLATTWGKTIERLENLLSNAKFSDIVYMMYKLSKKYPKLFTLSKVTIQIGGVMYGWDKIAEIYGIGDEQSTPQKQKVNQEDFDKYYENHKEEVNVGVMNNILALDTLQAGKLAIDILSSVE